MVLLLTKIKTDNIKDIEVWHLSTFQIRQSMGLIAVRAFTDSNDPNEYYILSFWEFKESVEAFMKNPDIAPIFQNKSILWQKILEPYPPATMGELIL